MSVPSPYAAALAAIPVREAVVEVRGSTVRYWEYGPVDRPVDLLLVHGFRGDHHGLEPIVSNLPGLRIVTPDLPGYGVSTAMPTRRRKSVGSTPPALTITKSFCTRSRLPSRSIVTD